MRNGPGLARPGSCDGDLTLKRIHDECSTLCKKLAIELDFRQTDDDDEMARLITQGNMDFNALVINPAGSAPNIELDIPVIEVHTSNIFRQDSETTRPLQPPDATPGFISGLGLHSYLLAIKALHKRWNDE